MANLAGKKIAILATHGFEQSELLQPRRALQDAGAETKVVSLERGKIKGRNDKKWGQQVPVDLTVDEAKPDDFDALLLPGGRYESRSSAHEPESPPLGASVLRRL